MELEELQRIVAAGESETVEFKKSTGLLTRAGETLCAFLNGSGGRVFFGIAPDGQIVGQQVSDKTQREVAAMLARFEPAAKIETERLHLANGHEVLVLKAKPTPLLVPFIFEGKPYQRIGPTTSVMPQEHYQALLLERCKDQSRWENFPATDFRLEDLDQEEILRTVRLGIEKGRLPEATGNNIGDILDRLELRKNGQILNAAVILFAKKPGPDYPQCLLRLAHFKGTDKTNFLDNRQFHGNAFALLNEAMEFFRNHLPISGRFESGKLERIDELLFPPDALREAIVNAICHRDYSVHGGSIGIAVFDNRVEVWSIGKLPSGISASDLKHNHPSIPRNETITKAFYRRGLIENWGRGTQRIIELCKLAGHPEPDFEEIGGSVLVTFKAAFGLVNPKLTTQVTTQVTAQVTTEVERLLPLCIEERTKQSLREHLALRNDSHFRKAYLAPALTNGLIEMTIPNKPNSRLQKYRLTAKGRAWVEQHPSK
jgi:ATP-dependent DNA helicase RecG